ncbi:McrB family protein [Rhizobium ruizarguesonis]|uniref:McrB family protein n=1 Tax=Rhizobium ruizarguesonis TaxID=2081791 RepID=UPI00103167D5|nr:DNA methyltransferase [Rhizobium ruizarguesonis]TBA91089.1 DNA methyltransferase [Rhizobium ruizarguesonis]
MALYVSAERLTRAFNALRRSRVKQGRLFDFLLVKRTLRIKGVEVAAITENEPAYLQALDELGSMRNREGEFFNAKYHYLNFFAAGEAKAGYRLAKYKSNGTNTTIAGDQWKRAVIRLEGSSPRQAGFQKDYEKHLSDLLILKSKKMPLPNLAETALWYFRGRDVSEIVAGAVKTKERIEKLENEFIDLFGLTKAEIDQIFVRSTNDDEAPQSPVFVDAAPDPAQYLPGKPARMTGMAAEDLSNVSFDLVAALAAKNFVILTGPSGTGKSRAALKLAEGLQLHYANEVDLSLFELVPVGPDWTSPKRLLGYKSPFGKERKDQSGATTNDGYDLTSTLRIILRASHPDAAETPHFLIFDEMNLSHVERYFAPFLSLMEAANILDEEGGVSLVSEGDLALISEILESEDGSSKEAEAAKFLMTDGKSFNLPPNLFFIGTVNVDETTYMFSPKVLDRAHVIELNAVRPSAYLRGGALPDADAQVSISVASELLKSSIEDRRTQRNEIPNPADLLQKASEYNLSESEIDEMRSQIIAALDGCYDLLTPVGFPFGYRVAKEVFVYVLSWLATKQAGGADKDALVRGWPDALDKAILQKVLPKVHGNKRVLSDSLRALSAFLAGNHSGSTQAASYNLGLGTTIGIAEASRLILATQSVQMPHSRRKLDAMHDRLGSTGYVSFVN